MFNVELYNKTERKVVASRQASTDVEASKVAWLFISRAKESGRVIHESNYDINPRGYVIGQTIYTDNAVYEVSTGKM